jgi:type VI protein secretion system component VasF
MTTVRCVPGQPALPHRFRRTLPVRVRARLDALLPQVEPEVAAAMERHALRSPDVDLRRITRQDVRDFLLAYGACLLALLVWFS